MKYKMPKVNKKDDVIIRLLEQKDETEALNIIWKVIFYKTSMDIIVDKVTGAPYIIFSLICGLIGFYVQYSFFQGVVIFLTPLCALYLFGRFVLLPKSYRNNSGFLEGLYRYWSRKDLGRYLWVAEVDGAIVGTAAVNTLSPTTCQVLRVAVKSQFRGKGIGQLLMTKVFEYCQKLNVDHIVLITSCMQVPAMKLYEKLGFQRIHTFLIGPPISYLKCYACMYHYSQKKLNPGQWGDPASVRLMQR